MSRRIVTLTTDFGLLDPYAAAMKGVVLTINPDAVLVDVTHDVRPQALLQTAYVTQAAWPFFPDGAIHVVVVDPGVGTERRALALVTPRGCYVGPDNGALSAALPDGKRPPEPGAVPLPSGLRAFAVTNERYLRTPVSATFHGRDVFAPAAAHLSLGVPPEELGEPVASIVALPPLRARRCDDGALAARVVHIDRFGNIITDARAQDLPDGPLAVEIAGRVVPGPVRTYAEASGLCALVGSSGLLEVALPGGSAGAELRAQIGDAVVVREEH